MYFEKRCQKIIEPKLGYTQCSFRNEHSTAGTVFLLQQIFKKYWEYAKDVYECFVD